MAEKAGQGGKRRRAVLFTDKGGMGRDAAADTCREALSEMDLVLQGHQGAFANARGWTLSCVPAPWKVLVRKCWSRQVGKEGGGMRESEKEAKVHRGRITGSWNHLG